MMLRASEEKYSKVQKGRIFWKSEKNRKKITNFDA